MDPDFFWHLKTGEWIWRNKHLPVNDPFAYTTSTVLDERETFLMTSYWISQLIYYFAYITAGFYGIIFLRFFIISAFFLILLKQQRDDKTIYFSLVLMFFISLLEMYPIERPQIFSFLFFGVLIFLLEKIKSGGRMSSLTTIGLPILLLFWSNFHGGYLIGQITLVLYILSEGIKQIHPSLEPLNRKTLRKLLIGYLFGIAFSFINPNTYHALGVSTDFSTGNINVEYKSSVEFLLNFKDYSIILNWFIMILTLSGIIIAKKKTDLSHIILLSGLGYFSFTQVRYMPFFLMAAIPLTCKNLSYSRRIGFWKSVCIMVALIAALFFSINEISKRKHITSGDLLNTSIYPAEAADFIIENNLQGKMYNDINWGGYLIWRLAPERKVFIDGRYLNKNVYYKAVAIENAYAGIWESLLETYNVNYIIVPFSRFDGSVPDIVNVLLQDSNWNLIFFRSNSMIFIRNVPANEQVIKKFSA